MLNKWPRVVKSRDSGSRLPRLKLWPSLQLGVIACEGGASQAPPWSCGGLQELGSPAPISLSLPPADCCVHCILSCLFCEFLTLCNIVLDCATCGSCSSDDSCLCCCCGSGECADCDLPCDLDCGILDACCESADCLEICMECCGLCFSS